MASILEPPHSAARLAELGERIRDGKLVSFPTETVYGLGANGLDRDAVLSIFHTKKRPLTDPVILHVCDLEGALKCFDEAALSLTCGATGSGQVVSFKDLLSALVTEFWPGPLSIIAPAGSHVPSEVSAGTGFIAVRCPRHSLALQLIKASERPIAAPSANLFSHISPTTAEHVLEDFPKEDVVIVRGENNANDRHSVVSGSGDCDIGIESTVIKMDIVPSSASNSVSNDVSNGAKSAAETNADSRADVGGDTSTHTGAECSSDANVDAKNSQGKLVIRVLRKGGVTPAQLEAALAKWQVEIIISGKKSSSSDNSTANSLGTASSNISEEPASQSTVASPPAKKLKLDKVDNEPTSVSSAIPQVSPGMLLTHYAPRQPTFLISAADVSDTISDTAISNSTKNNCNNFNEKELQQIDPARCVLVDFKGSLAGRSKWGQVFELSEAGCIAEATRNIFKQLRAAEYAADNAGDFTAEKPADAIVVCDIMAYSKLLFKDEQVEAAEALYDRVFRAASGKKCRLLDGKISAPLPSLSQ